MKYTAGLTISTENRDKQAHAFRVMTDMSQSLSSFFSDMSIHAYSSDESEDVRELSDEDLYFDEYTALKVLKAIMSSGLAEHSAMVVVAAMQKEGILFRERGPSKDLILQTLFSRVTNRCPICDAPVSAPNADDAEVVMYRHILDEHHIAVGKQERYKLDCPHGDAHVSDEDFNFAVKTLRDHLLIVHPDKE